ncbi:hypothetical protein CSUI_005381 [Cystoisospora suis]|uniref:Transmembrane protein n=1 Tax=Cystoisospora suis TaxID=483139 RepID=A0A2C6KTZ5_9APIC|nr:hypothetical protein CSUI_005381 [Cystoisospora suis]
MEGGEPSDRADTPGMPTAAQPFSSPPYRVTASRSIHADHLVDCIPQDYGRTSRASSGFFDDGDGTVCGFLPCYDESHRHLLVILFSCWLLELLLSSLCLAGSLSLVCRQLGRVFLLRNAGASAFLIVLTSLLMVCMVPTTIFGYLGLRAANPRRLKVCTVFQAIQLVVSLALGGYLIYLIPPLKQLLLPWEYFLMSTCNLLLLLDVSVLLHFCQVLTAAYRQFLDKISYEAASQTYDTFEESGMSPPAGLTALAHA